jgi:hypothetical protein
LHSFGLPCIGRLPGTILCNAIPPLHAADLDGYFSATNRQLPALFNCIREEYFPFSAPQLHGDRAGADMPKKSPVEIDQLVAGLKRILEGMAPEEVANEHTRLMRDLDDGSGTPIEQLL